VAIALFVLNVSSVKKLAGVALVGTLLLVIALVVLRERGTHEDAPPASAGMAPATASGTAPAATATIAPSSTAAPLPPLDDAASCSRLAALCSTSNEKVDPDECRKELADARKMAGAGNVEKSERCLAEANTCAAASGCLSGGVGMGAMGEFLKGLGAALSK
jgi:hypothetical protein